MFQMYHAIVNKLKLKKEYPLLRKPLYVQIVQKYVSLFSPYFLHLEKKISLASFSEENLSAGT